MEATKEKHATHTPGPWHAWYCKENETGGGIFQDTNAESQRMICRMAKEKRVIHKDKRKSDDFVHSAEDEANARLIAAAPEMYEMCKLLEECMENIDGRDGWDASYELAKVREVLAKVEGGEG
tara:strand:- start:5 stop:373 length:369 start_codon:yes stop_codon:yes gene_type:complete